MNIETLRKAADLTSILRKSEQVLLKPSKDKVDAALTQLMKKKQKMVWKDVDEALLMRSILSGDTDPRTDLESTCAFVGKASPDMPKSHIISLCVPKGKDPCGFRICVSLKEAEELIDKHKNEESFPNPWYDQLVKRKISGVKTMLGQDFVEAVRLQRKTIALASDLRDPFSTDGKERVMRSFIASSAVDYIRKNPTMLSIGNFLAKWTPDVIKRLLSSTADLLKWLFYNPVYSSFLLLFSKALNMVVCCWASGVTAEELKYALKGLMINVRSNPIVGLVIDIGTTILSCVMGAATLDVMGVMSCLKNVMTGMIGQVYSWTVKPIVQLGLYVTESVLRQIPFVGSYLSKAPGSVSKCMESPKLCIEWLWSGGDAGKSLAASKLVSDSLRKEALSFLLICGLHMIPYSWIDTLLNLVATSFGMGPVVSPIQAALKGSTHTSVGDAIYKLVKAGTLVANIVMIYKAVVSTIRQVFGCIIKKYFAKLTGKSAPDDQACCMREFVEEIKAIVAAPVSQGVRGFIKNLWASDARLKNRLFKEPVSHLDIGQGKRVPLYLFIYKNDATKTPMIGMMAQDVQRLRPSIVVELKGHLALDTKKLPCSTVTRLTKMNQWVVPSRCALNRGT